MNVRTRPIHPNERDRWLSFRRSLWPDSPVSELAKEMGEFFADRERAVVVFAVDAADEPLGFVEATRRECAEGCAPCPAGVAYIEAWYVEPDHRLRGVGAALLAAAEAWAAEHGCREMASDTEIDNQSSIDAHRAAGFAEVARVVLFRKAIIS